MPTLQDALDTLAAVPPKAFTRERDALAGRLREAGDTTAAAQVKARRAPTLPVWVVNRLALEHSDDVEALVSAAERVKAAQLGRGTAGTLTTATADHRAALDHLLDRAEGMLREAGGGVTHDKLLRVQNTLTAAAVDPHVRTALRAGQLDRELTAPGFDVFGGARPSATPRASKPVGAKAEPKPAPTGAGARAAKAEERRAQREAERAQRQERIAHARTVLTEARRQAVGARERVTETEGRLRELLEEVQQARKALRERMADARRQDAAVKQAQLELSRAERKADA